MPAINITKKQIDLGKRGSVVIRNARLATALIQDQSTVVGRLAGEIGPLDVSKIEIDDSGAVIIKDAAVRKRFEAIVKAPRMAAAAGDTNYAACGANFYQCGK